jgi:hypothetical protein
MRQIHKLHDFIMLEEADSKKMGSFARWAAMAFRPCGTILFCLAIILIVGD